MKNWVQQGCKKRNKTRRKIGLKKGETKDAKNDA